MSGNPAGRKPRSVDRTLAALDQVGRDATDSILAATIARARAGDEWAATLILARTWPPKRHRPVAPIDLPAMASAADLPGVLIAAAARGELAPGEAGELAGLLKLQGEAYEAADREARLVALESQMGEGAPDDA